MSHSDTSRWIPRRRIGIALAITSTLGLVAAIGARWSPIALFLLVPAAGAGWATFVMMRIRHQLSPGGGGWERRVHEFVVTTLDIDESATLITLDIGCGDAGLVVRMLERSPRLRVSGVDLWASNWDYDQASCEARLSALGHTASFHQMDAADLSFADATFDVVTSVMCFHEVRAADGSSDGPLVALREAMRVLRPGGRFAFIDGFGAKDAFPPATVDAVFRSASGVRRIGLVSELSVPWPLNSKRALGPAELITGTKPTSPL